MAIKILLAEDDSTMRKLLKTFLELEGFTVVAENCEQDLRLMLQTIRVERPQVIIMDVFLGDLDGFDILHAVRSDEDLHDLTIIMSSGADLYERCLKEGADAFIMKPYIPDQLVQTIHETLAMDEDRR